MLQRVGLPDKDKGIRSVIKFFPHLSLSYRGDKPRDLGITVYSQAYSKVTSRAHPTGRLTIEIGNP